MQSSNRSRTAWPKNVGLLSAETLASDSEALSTVATSLVEPHGSRHSFQLDSADVDELHARVSRDPHNVVAHQDLVGPRVCGDPRRHVDRPSEAVTILEAHRPGGA